MTNTKELILSYLEEQPGEAARVLESLDCPDSAAFLEEIPPEPAGRVLGVMLPWYGARCLQEMDPERAGERVLWLASFRAAGLLRQLPEGPRRAVLEALPRSKAKSLLRQIQFAPNTVGGWMEAFVPALPAGATVEEGLQYARRLGHGLNHHLCVVKDDGTFLGGVGLARMISAHNSLRVEELLDPDLPALPVHARLRSVRYHPGWARAHALPVVNSLNHLQGMLAYDQLREGLAEGAAAGNGGLSLLSGLVPAYLACLNVWVQVLSSLPLGGETSRTREPQP